MRTANGMADTLQSLVSIYRASLVDALPLASALNALLASDLSSLQEQEAGLEQPSDLSTSCLHLPGLFSDDPGVFPPLLPRLSLARSALRRSVCELKSEGTDRDCDLKSDKLIKWCALISDQ